MRAFRHKKQHNYPSYKLSTHNCGIYVLVYTGAQYIKTYTLAQLRPIAVHVFGRTPMLFTKTPSQKGAVHKIARPEKKWRFSTPFKMDGRADGNQKKSIPLTPCMMVLEGFTSTHSKRFFDESVLVKLGRSKPQPYSSSICTLAMPYIRATLLSHAFAAL